MIAEGSSKLSSVPSGGGAVASSGGGAAAAGGAPAAAAEKEEEKKEEEKVRLRPVSDHLLLGSHDADFCSSLFSSPPHSCDIVPASWMFVVVYRRNPTTTWASVSSIRVYLYNACYTSQSYTIIYTLPITCQVSSRSDIPKTLNMFDLPAKLTY